MKGFTSVVRIVCLVVLMVRVECTSNLDTETEASILRNIWPFLDGKTVIVVTHRFEAVEDLVDEVVVIQ